VRRAIDDARAAFDRNDWGETHRLLSEFPVDDLSAEDVDRLATASYLTGRDETAFELWTRLHRDCARTSQIELAARFGLRLAQTMGFKGDIARSAGWVERTAKQLDLESTLRPRGRPRNAVDPEEAEEAEGGR